MIHHLIKSLLIFGWFLFLSGPGLFAKENALIVIGTTGTDTIAADLGKVAQDIQAGLVQRGFSPDSIEILGASGARVNLDQVQASLKTRQTLAPTDEFWLVLLGFSGRNADGAPAFQISGPRLIAADLKTSLDAIPAKQFIFVGTSDSGGFVLALLKANRNVLSATSEEGEIDLPRYPEAWAAALKEKPQASWKEIAARASEIVVQTYSDNSLALGEHARLGDPVTGQVLEPPFGVDKTAPPEEKMAGSNSMALINASDIKVDIRKPNAEWEKHEATPETKKLIEAARATPNPDGFNSILLEQRLGYSVGEDRTSEDFIMRRVYIEKEDGVEHWANYTFPQDPPAVSTKLEAARIIQPDGSSTVFNPAKMPPATSVTSGYGNALTTIFLPDAHAGCLIEIAYRTHYLLDADLPEFTEELPVQLDIPVVHSELQLQVAEKGKLHFKLRNSDQKPSSDVVASGLRTVSWTMENLPAFEPLPFDPPARDFVLALDVSSLDSWDEFAAWYRRLAQGSDEQDAAVKAKAEELAEGATTRIDKIRRAYEFVAALRYVAIEIGVNGYRPRTPAVVLQNRYGDCKDKANLLIALLADMGIEGRFTLLNRFSSTDMDFPSNQFNHAIAFVPKADGQPDDLWLDSTDSTAPFPTLSPGDIGRNAFVFNKDKAEFHTVVAPGNDVTNIDEHWNFSVMSAGTWSGDFKKTCTGLADYDVRSSIRGLTPRQRDFTLQTELTRQLPNADFVQFTLTSADDLSQPMQVKASVATAYPPHPSTAFDVAGYFASPERNRPLLINNGQKLHLLQTVDVSDPTSTDPVQVPFDKQTAGIHASIKWEKTGDHAWRRTAELTVDQPYVAQTDYKELRSMLMTWMGTLTH